MSNELIQLKLTLNDSKPAIWRRIIVHRATSLFELHHIIQIAMGWTNSHLFQFFVHNYRIGLCFTEDEEFNDNFLDAMEVSLESVITDINDTIVYTYDFGDDWHHNITIEKYLSVDKNPKYPICTDGVMNCPPEDCGSMPGFKNLVKILKNNKHPEYKEMRTWVGRSYDPNDFNIEKVNKNLSKLDKYIRDWIRGWNED